MRQLDVRFPAGSHADHEKERLRIEMVARHDEVESLTIAGSGVSRDDAPEKNEKPDRATISRRSFGFLRRARGAARRRASGSF